MRKILTYIKKFSIFFIGFLITGATIHAQHLSPLEYNTSQLVEKAIAFDNLSISSSMKPYLIYQLQPELNYDSLLLLHHQQIIRNDRSWFFRKLRYENFFVIKQKDFIVTVDPILILNLGKEQNNHEILYRNTRGIIISGMLGKNLTFNSSFYENQAVFPAYINDFVYDYEVIPGQAYPKAYPDSTYFDFSWANGSIAYSPWKCFTVQLGQGKFFIGNGYRSLLLSDNSYNYPYLLLDFQFGKFTYHIGYTSFMDLHYPNTVFKGFNKKTGILHYLTWKPINSLEVSFFETTICNNPDSSGRYSLEWQLINPVIFINSFSDKGANSITGINMSYSIARTAQLYGQAFLTQWDWNRGGFQVGLKYFDAFGFPGLFLQTEFNQAAPYSYTSPDPKLAYVHYNQPLASPLGANFKESISKVDYQYRSWLVELQYNYSLHGADTIGSNFGSTIFLPYYGINANIIQGIKTKNNIINLNLSYIINPKTNFLITLGYTYRDVHSNLFSKRTNIIYISLHHQLNNFYYDF